MTQFTGFRFKRLALTALLCVLVSPRALADVPWIPFNDSQYLGSFELLVSGEHEFSSRLSLGVWGGGAYVFALTNGDVIHNLGLELAVEPRLVLIGSHDQGLFLGGYLGAGLMQTSELYRSRSRDRNWIKGVSLGAKLGYRLTMAQTGAGTILLEPYFSFSEAIYDDTKSNMLMTLGLRLVFNLTGR